VAAGKYYKTEKNRPERQIHDIVNDWLNDWILICHSGGTVLGGCYQKNNWDPLPDPNLANRIMKRAIELAPQLVKEGQGVEGLDIIRHGVGLRPLREGGSAG